MDSCNYFINIRDRQYLAQTLVHYGIMLQNNRYNIVRSVKNSISPYITITEGIILHPKLNNQIRTIDNARVYKNDIIVCEKQTNKNIGFINFYDQYVYDLYDLEEHEFVYSEIDRLELSKDIYCTNTEIVENEYQTDSLVGLASGSKVAELAYSNRCEMVTYFDYSVSSIEFQKQLIYSSDRKQTFLENLERLTTGYTKANIIDIEKIDFSKLNVWYDYLRKVHVEFHVIDFRKDDDINFLLTLIPEESVLWISNVWHYITSLDYYSQSRYELLDDLAKSKGIKILPHTRIYYVEG